MRAGAGSDLGLKRECGAEFSYYRDSGGDVQCTIPVTTICIWNIEAKARRRVSDITALASLLLNQSPTIPGSSVRQVYVHAV